MDRYQVRAVGNAVNLATPLGLVIARLGRASIRRGPRGLVLGEGYQARFPVAGAFTVGNVVTTRGTWAERARRHPDLLAHEEGHTWQYLYFLGLPYLPAYVAAMVWSWLRTGDRASSNLFERRAGLAAGGYAERPIRPLRTLRASTRGRRSGERRA